MLSIYLLTAAIGYLLGSIPTGYLAGRTRGMDIRKHGSGNIGATNVVRVLGKRLGGFVFFCDALKGLLAVVVGSTLISAEYVASISDNLPETIIPAQPHGVGFEHAAFVHFVAIGGIVGALACILGHNFPVWLRFKGGKGIATSAGALLGMMPEAVGVTALVWVIAFYTLRYVSVASMLAAVTLPLAVVLLWRAGRADSALIWFSLFAAALAVWRHRSNIQRLLNGTEPRFAPKSKTPPPTEPAPLDDASGPL
jgi:glycerol-3-phosphate acyltransferase PlsY